MSRLRTLAPPRRFLPHRLPFTGLTAPPGHAFRAWWTRLLASMPRGNKQAQAQELTLVLWTSSIEGIATNERQTLH